MNVQRDAWWLGWMLLALAAAQAVPALAALLWGEPSLPYWAGAVTAAVFGGPIVASSRPGTVGLRARDGFAIASAGWVLASLFGAVPYLTSGALGPVDAWFESVAGFTTTAASALDSVESQPHALLLWRSLSQWLGGLGVLVVGVAVIASPTAGRARASDDATGTRVAGQLATIAIVYAAGAIALCIALRLAGLSGFDAVCHALTTVSTGGFSTRDASVGALGSATVEWWLVVGMLFGAISPLAFARVATGRGRGVAADPELRFFAAAAVVAVASIVVANGDAEPVRASVFGAVSLLSGTGFYSADFARWGGFAQLVLIGAMVVGGTSGSTTGGIRSLRLAIGMGVMRDSFRSLLHPHAVRRVKLVGRVVPDDEVAATWAFITAYFMCVGAAASLVALAGYDLVTSLSVAFSATANVGPAFGAAGPGDGYAQFPGTVKLGLGLAMLVGRLDVFPLLVLLRPGFWRA